MARARSGQRCLPRIWLACLAFSDFSARRRVQEEEDQSLSFLGERMESMTRQEVAFRVGLPGGVPHDSIRRMVCPLPYARIAGRLETRGLCCGPDCGLWELEREGAASCCGDERTPMCCSKIRRLAAHAFRKEAGSNLSLIFPRRRIRLHDIEDAYQTGLYTLPKL